MSKDNKGSHAPAHKPAEPKATIATEHDAVQPKPKSDTAPVFNTESPISPTIGRVVHYRHSNGKTYPALVTTAWSNNCVNLCIANDGSTKLPQDDLTPTSATYSEDPGSKGTWCWMEFQKGQAQKTDTLTPRVDHLYEGMSEMGEAIDELKERLDALSAPSTGVQQSEPAQTEGGLTTERGSSRVLSVKLTTMETRRHGQPYSGYTEVRDAGTGQLLGRLVPEPPKPAKPQ